MSTVSLITVLREWQAISGGQTKQFSAASPYKGSPTNWPNPLTGQPYKAEPPELSILSLRGPAPGALRGIISENCNLRNIHVVTKTVV